MYIRFHFNATTSANGSNIQPNLDAVDRRLQFTYFYFIIGILYL